MEGIKKEAHLLKVQCNGEIRKKRKKSKFEAEPIVKYGILSKGGRTITRQSCGNVGHNKYTCKGQGEAPPIVKHEDGQVQHGDGYTNGGIGQARGGAGVGQGQVKCPHHYLCSNEVMTHGDCYNDFWDKIPSQPLFGYTLPGYGYCALYLMFTSELGSQAKYNGLLSLVRMSRPYGLSHLG
ncbi:hypothetical protein Tco_1012671 [Tanacetum coccineum]